MAKNVKKLYRETNKERIAQYKSVQSNFINAHQNNIFRVTPAFFLLLVEMNRKTKQNYVSIYSKIYVYVEWHVPTWTKLSRV